MNGSPYGFVIVGLTSSGAAEQAGLAVVDVIFRLQGRAAATGWLPEARDLQVFHWIPVR